MTDVADVELRQVRKSFGDVIAVDGVSVRVDRGEFFSLLGPSGCGKTTTLRLIAGFEHPTDGEVLIQGRSMGSMPAFTRNVNTVFQQYALFPHMSVAENVAFGLRMKRVRRSEIAAQVEEALDLVRLGGYGSRRTRELSGGQQQRVAVARALINRPAVLLLDEPLGALDLKLRKQMQAELKRLQKSVGTTFIYVTHDQEEALTMSDRIAVMGGGRIVQVGSPEAIYESPASRFVAEFIGESNFLEGTVSGIESDRITVVVDGAPPIVVRRPASPVAIGKRIALSVRPERIDLAYDDASTGANGVTIRLAGRIEEVVYRGSDSDVLVRVADHTLIRARVQRGSDSLAGWSLAPGAVVTVSWAASATSVLPVESQTGEALKEASVGG